MGKSVMEMQIMPHGHDLKIGHNIDQHGKSLQQDPVLT
jgi:hypothetical protein